MAQIVGKWILVKGQVEEDENCKRIQYLITNQLKKITTSITGWETLYQDSNDGRYWELKYLQSDLHGGGHPPYLKSVWKK